MAGANEYDVNVSLLVTADNVAEAVQEALRLIFDSIKLGHQPGQVDVRDLETGELHDDLDGNYSRWDELLTSLAKCDHCQVDLRHDLNGYWVGPDGTSDCPESDGGHTVNGGVR